MIISLFSHIVIQRLHSYHHYRNILKILASYTAEYSTCVSTVVLRREQAQWSIKEVNNLYMMYQYLSKNRKMIEPAVFYRRSKMNNSVSYSIPKRNDIL